MTALILMLTWLPQVLSAEGELPRPVNLTLTSDHFSTMLTWEPGPGTPPGVHYRADVISTKEVSWTSVAGCERIVQPLLCNLTQAFADRSQDYFTRVTAVLGSRGAAAAAAELNGTFKPLRDTHLDLPLLIVSSCGRNLCVDLRPPVDHLRDTYESLRYRLRSRSAGRDSEKDITSLRTEVLENPSPGLRYCFSIRFSDSLVPRQSDYSPPVCAVSPSDVPTDALVGGGLCLLVIMVVVSVVLLVASGSICPIRKPLPHVLTSFQHLDGVVVASPCRASLSSLVQPDPTAPSAGRGRSSRTPSHHSEEEEEEEADTETTTGSSGGGRGRGNYKLWVGTNFLCSSSSSSSSLSAPLSPEEGATPGVSSDQQAPPDSNHLHPQAPDAPPVTETTEEEEEEEEEQKEEQEQEQEEVMVVEEDEGQDVNLLTLTFGRHEEEQEEQEEQEEEFSSSSQVNNATPLMDTEEVAIETVSCSLKVEEEEEEVEEEEEEEEEDDSGYMQRPSTRYLL